MILYTIYDPSVIFENIDYYNPQNTKTSFSEIEIHGVKVQVVQMGNEEARIERILSTNPSHYLDPRLQPGRIIPASKKEEG